MPNYFGFITWILQLLQKYWQKLQLTFKSSYFRHHQSHHHHHHQQRLLQQFIGHGNGSNAQTQLNLKREHRLVQQIPEARGLPLVGTFFDLIAAGAAPNLHKYIDQRHKQLGHIFRERLGGTQDAVFVSSASLMRSIFLFEGQFPKHPLPDAWKLYNAEHKCERGLFFMNGTEWLHNRRLLNRFLLNGGNLDWTRHINDCTEKFVSEWRTLAALHEEDGQDGRNDGPTTHTHITSAHTEVLNLEQQLYRWAIDVICSIMFGATSSHCPQLEAMVNDFSKIVHKIFESSAVLMNFPPQLAKRLNLKFWKDFESSVQEVLQKGFEIIDRFVSLHTKRDEESEMDVLVFDDNEVLLNKLKAAGMPMAMIKRIFVDLVIAAGDTTAYTTEWALYLLAQDPDMQQRLRKEVLASDGVDTPLVRGLLRETLRLYPVAPFIGRYLATDAIIDDYELKKDTLVLLSLYTAGRSAQHFPNPTAVLPERWLRDPHTGMLQGVLEAHGTIPFAIGQRSCIGKKVAIHQMQSLIAKVISNFQLTCLNVTPIECRLRLVTVPDPPLQLGIKLLDHA